MFKASSEIYTNFVYDDNNERYPGLSEWRNEEKTEIMDLFLRIEEDLAFISSFDILIKHCPYFLSKLR